MRRFWLVSTPGVWEYTPPGETDASYVPVLRQRDYCDGSEDFRSFPISRQSGVFTCTFESSPLGAETDGVTGLCAVDPLSFYDLAVIVRFSPDGLIDARDGGVYRAEEDIPYTSGAWYSIRLVVDIPAHRYDAFVTPPDGVERAIGRGLAFRTEQNRVPYLERWALWSGVGQHRVRNLVVR